MLDSITLPEIEKPKGILLEKAIILRRSKRGGWKEKISLEELSGLLWSAQGKTDNHHRTVPSAGATYPLEIFILAKSVDRINQGIYKYSPESHSISKLKQGDFSKELGEACGKYTFVKDAPLSIIISADFERTTARFGKRGNMYVHMEAGSAYQNISLEAINLDLGTVVVGAFNVEKVKQFIENEFEPLCILPIG